MNTGVEKYISEAKLRKVPKKKLGLVINDEAITTPKIAQNAVTSSKVNDGAITLPKINSNAIDSYPHKNSYNLITSDGVANAIKEKNVYAITIEELNEILI